MASYYAGLNPLVGMPLIGAEQMSTVIVGTESGGVYELPRAAPVTAAQATNDIAPRYDMTVADFGSFIIPPVGAFQVADSNNNGSATTATLKAGGPQATSAAAPNNISAVGGKFVQSQTPVWAACVFPVLHPKISKNSMILMEPDLEALPAAINSFKSSITNWHNNYPCAGGVNTAVIQVATTLAATASSSPFGAAGAGGAFTSDAYQIVAGTGKLGPISTTNLRNFGQIAIMQVDNGSIWIMCAAGPEWPCYGMRVKFIVIEPPVDVRDCGFNNSRYAITQAGVCASTQQESQIHAALSRG